MEMRSEGRDQGRLEGREKERQGVCQHFMPQAVFSKKLAARPRASGVSTRPPGRRGERAGPAVQGPRLPEIWGIQFCLVLSAVRKYSPENTLILIRGGDGEDPLAL